MIGFLTGAIPALGLLALLPPGEMQEVGGVTLVIEGHRTAAGWAELFRAAGLAGLVGLVAAIVFRAVAVRPVSGD